MTADKTMKMRPSPKFTCGMVVSFTEDGEVFMKHGKSGCCPHASAEAIARLINAHPDKDAVIKQLSHIKCECAIPGYGSCYDFISKQLKDMKPIITLKQ